MGAPGCDRALLLAARHRISRFEDTNWEQQKLRAFLLTLLAYMERVFCRPGQEHELLRWWSVVDEYWRVLASPALAGKGRRAVLSALLGDDEEIHDHELDGQRLSCEVCLAGDLEAETHEEQRCEDKP